MEVNTEMIPNLSRRAAESLKIESHIKISFLFLENIYIFRKNQNLYLNF
jgi:hypothetical protein